MKYWLNYIIAQSVSHALIITALVTFLESLALVGLILPGIIFMTTIGTLIGKGKIPLYPTWIIGIIGCLLGDYISYYIGWKFKNWIYKIKILKNNTALFNKIKFTLHKYSMLTVLIGKFIGPIRPFVSMIAGMIKLPLKRFYIPSLISCVLWPLIYFLPGIITGIITNHPNYNKNNSIKWILIFIFLNIWFGSYLIWTLWNHKNTNNILKKISKKNIALLIIINFSISIISLFYVQHNMKIFILKEILCKIFNI